MTRHIPNTITCLNLLSGCLAILFAFNAYGYPVAGWPQGWVLCCIFIGLAALFDFCDGAAARALKAYSPIGAELDSLSDLVSFGLAPAMLLYNIAVHNTSASNWLALGVFVLPVCGALRLARFNVCDTGSTTFRGLPIPAGALFAVGVAGWINSNMYPGTLAVVALAALTGAAMVSRFTMFSLKFKNFAVHSNLRRYVLIVAAVVFVVMYGLSGLAWTVLFYLLMSLMSQRGNN